MKKIIVLLFCLISIFTFANEKVNSQKISLNSDNKNNKNYNVEIPENTQPDNKEKYDYYEKRGEESPQFDNLSFMEKLGVMFASWTKSPDTVDHMENKDNSNLDKKLTPVEEKKKK